MSRLENDIFGNASGQVALDAMITRSTDALLIRKNKKRLIMHVDSTEAYCGIGIANFIRFGTIKIKKLFLTYLLNTCSFKKI
jgi:hypothetical protein